MRTTNASSQGRLPELDLLRFVAAVSVMLFHFFRWADDYHTPLGYGWLGVKLFFTISGFVILWSALGKTPLEFAISRFTRLYPSYWLCVLIATAAATLWGSRHIGAGQVLANLTMLQNPLGQPDIDAIYWTLFVELKFYAMVAVLLLLKKQQFLERWLGVWLLSVCVSVWLPWVGRLTLGEHAPFFIFGAICFLVRRDGMTTARAVMLLVAAVLGIYFSTIPGPMLLHYGVTSGVTVAAILLVIDAAFVALALGRLKLPGTRYAYALGCLTYPLYLIHSGLGLPLWRVLPLSAPLRIVILSVLSLALAAAIARLIEYRGCGRFNRFLNSYFGRARRTVHVLGMRTSP